jgi:predicted AAA+ superfamily ATPase
MKKTPWTPWKEVVKLREDLRSGELTMAMFAADLNEVVMHKGRSIYQKPEEFFALTYPTFNLR